PGDEVVGDGVDDAPESLDVVEQRGDVLEHDPGRRPVRDVADPFLDVRRVHGGRPPRAQRFFVFFRGRGGMVVDPAPVAPRRAAAVDWAPVAAAPVLVAPTATSSPPSPSPPDPAVSAVSRDEACWASIRARSWRLRGSRSFIQVTTGAAMKIDE